MNLLGSLEAPWERDVKKVEKTENFRKRKRRNDEKKGSPESAKKIEAETWWDWYIGKPVRRLDGKRSDVRRGIIYPPPHDEYVKLC